MTFSIDLKKRRQTFDHEENPNIDGVIDDGGKSAVVNFYSFFGAKNGEAFLRMVGGRLICHVVRNPSEGGYAPRDAILVSHQFMMERIK
ncbi:hypothetical protein [Burkholderia metallica]|uniref:hypothetical protein n=1 Tax=Burkholderia metallica TaxID=488729 RepID=UPI00158D59C8|nr:hypothetical protein [Burkholderia metallica]